MKKKQLFAIVLALCLTLSLLTGCGDTANSPGSAGDAPEAISSVEANATEPAAPETPDVANEADPEENSVVDTAASAEEAPEECPYPYEITMPLCDDIQYFTFWGTMSSKALPYVEQLGQASVYKYVGDLTNLYMDATCVSGSAAAEQFALVVASGDWPDVTSVVPNTYAGGIEAALSDEFILEFTAEAEENMPNLMYLLDEYPEYKSKFSDSDGELCCISSITVDELDTSFNRGLGIRTDWAQEYGSIPDTYEQLHDFLTWAKESKGANSALWLDNFGTGGNGNLAAGYNISYSMDTMGGSRPYFLMDGKVACGLIADGLKDYLTMMHVWYDEGLLYNDFVTTEHSLVNDAAAKEALLNGQIAVGLFSVEDLPTMDAMGVALEPMADITKNPDDELGISPVETSSSVGGATGSWTISSSIDQALLPLLLQWIDYFCTPEGATVASYGVEGEAWEYNEDGEIQFTELITGNPELTWKILCTVYMTDGAPGLFYSQRNRLTYTDAQNNALVVWPEKQTGKYALSSSVSVPTELSEEYNQYAADVETYATENILKFIIGQIDIEAEWDNYVSSLKSLGIERMIEIMQEGYDDYLENLD